MEMLDQVLAFIEQNLFGSSVAIGIVTEFCLRMFPSEKPLSIAYGVAAACKMAGMIFTKFGEFLDKVLPQKTVQ